MPCCFSDIQLHETFNPSPQLTHVIQKKKNSKPLSCVSEFQDIELEETFNPSPVRSPRPLDDPRYRHLFVDKKKKGRPRQGETQKP
jgi:hypothetical protein